MKAPNIIIFYILAIVCLTNACRIKDLNTQKSRNIRSETDEISMLRNDSELYSGQRSVLVSDSINHQYKVKIFPIDTFNFSWANGFTGRAASIEVTGLAHLARKTSDSSVVFAARRTNIDYQRKTDAKILESSNSKILKKKVWGIPFWIWTGAGTIMVLLFVRFLTKQYCLPQSR